MSKIDEKLKIETLALHGGQDAALRERCARELAAMRFDR